MVFKVGDKQVEEIWSQESGLSEFPTHKELSEHMIVWGTIKTGVSE